MTTKKLIINRVAVAGVVSGGMLFSLTSALILGQSTQKTL